MLQIYNSLARKKEIFKPQKLKEVSLYVCGITPYDTTHLGHAYTYICFDILVRYLNYVGYKVKYTQNVTDINDRDNDLLKRALEQNIPWQKLGDFWTKRFLSDMKALNWIMPTNYVKASESIDSMIDLINAILKNGFAYKKNGSVYFDISKKNDFGKLSRLNSIQMLKKAKEFEEDTENPDKENRLDITLWRAKTKNQPEHIPSFESPWGLGRPGWHIECSAMAISTLGESIDIHGGGIDLIFPHHESEIAQAESATLEIPFSRFWMHVAPVCYKGEKMSKSLGNVIMISNLLKKYSANVIRWYLISHHYREGFEFHSKYLEVCKYEFSQITSFLNSKTSKKTEKAGKYLNDFLEALSDDLNTPAALKIINKMLTNNGSSKDIKTCLDILGFKI